MTSINNTQSQNNFRIFLGQGDQNIKKWLAEFHIMCQANEWKERQYYDAMVYYLKGEAKEWYERNKSSLFNIKLLEEALIEKYSIHITLMPYRFTFPGTMVCKIKEVPPQTQISHDFFKLCVVAACTKREVLMDYKTEKIGHRPLLDSYLTEHFSRNGRLNFNYMNIIGNILLCCVPDSFCEFIPSYREKLHAKSIFDSDIEQSELSETQKKIIKDKLQIFNMENSKICGYIMNNFMIRCAKGIPLPDISFLTEHTVCLTANEKLCLDTF